MTPPSHDTFAAFVGIDWAEAKHDICLQAAGTAKRECLQPGDKGLVQARGSEYGKDAPKRLVRRRPMGQVQKRREPRRLGLPPVFDLDPAKSADALPWVLCTSP